MENSEINLREILTKTIEDSPLWWWVRPFYDSKLFAPGYLVSFNYIGTPNDLERCAKEFKKQALHWLKHLSDEEFDNHPSQSFGVGHMTYFLYIGGPGSPPCCP